MSVDSIVDRVGGDPGYIKFLITERHAIRSALEARGVCLDEEARTLAYPSSIGNSLHLDLIEIERWLAAMPQTDRRLLDNWARRQLTRPAYGGFQLGRINRLIEAYLNESQKSEETARPGARVHLRGASESEQPTTTGRTDGTEGVLPEARDPGT